MRRPLVFSIALGVFCALNVSSVFASFVQLGAAPLSPPSSDIGARIRWGGTGFEASLYDSNPFGQSPTMNPGGAPVWQVGVGYGFEVTFDSVTGELGLKVDFNRDNSFAANEQITRTLFSNPGQTSYAGRTFEYLTISGNGFSNVSDLTIRGAGFTGITAAGAFTENWYSNQNLALNGIKVTGKLTFDAAGTAQESPSWNFRFRTSTPVVPEPSSFAIFGLGAVLMMARNRRSVVR